MWKGVGEMATNRKRERDLLIVTKELTRTDIVHLPLLRLKSNCVSRKKNSRITIYYHFNRYSEPYSHACWI